MPETSTTTLKLNNETKERLKRLAEAQERTPHWLMKRAIEEYVDREEKREQFRRDTIAASEEFDRTGLHLTGEEVDAWFEKIINGEDAELPECHT